MPVSKSRPKIPRLYFSVFRKTCELSHSELAEKLKVSKSMIDRYENGSCDFQVDKITEIFSDFAELCGIPVSVLLRNETDYQNAIISLRSNLGSDGKNFATVSGRRQLSNILVLKSKMSLSDLPNKLKKYAELRLLYPNWLLSQLAYQIGLTINLLNIEIKTISTMAEEFLKKENEECQ